MSGIVLHADRPVTSSDEDLLDRSALVTQLSRWCVSAPMDGGFVVGLTGPWGSGKTSVLSLLAEHLADGVTVVWFEPWLFSDADQLVSRFFDEVASQLGLGRRGRLKRLADDMADYGHALSPSASALLGPLGQALALPRTLQALREKSMHQRRIELQRALQVAKRRIVVLIDDIDRLDPREVREVLRLVKLVADLPGVVHVLSYDRARVEDALVESGIKDGRAFMEKIVQATMAVPPVSKDRLHMMSFDWLQEAIGERELESWNAQAWEALRDRAISEYLRTLRDGRRLANIAPAALDLCEDEVASMDVLALEALRIFDPAIHEALPRIAHILAGTSRDLYDIRERSKIDEENGEELASLLTKSAHPQATRRLLSELFPAAGRVLNRVLAGYIHEPLKAKRVASPAVLMRYLHLTLETSQAPSAAVDRAVRALGDADAFRACLDAVEDSRLGDLLARARSRIDEAARPEVVECARILLDLIPRLPPWHQVYVSPETQVRWFIETLVEHLPSVPARAEAARSIIKLAPTLSLRLDLLYVFRVPPDGPSQEPQLDLLEGPQLAEIEKQLAAATMDADDGQLAAEPSVWSLLEVVRDSRGPRAVLKRLQSESVLCALFEMPNTRVRPNSGREPIVDIEPVVHLAGIEVLPSLRSIARSTSPLTDDVRVALLEALSTFRRTSRRRRR